MPSSPSSKSSSLKVRQHRDRLRKQGLRPVQIWVPDTRTPEFALQAHAQAGAIALSSHAEDDQDFIDAISDRSET